METDQASDFSPSPLELDVQYHDIKRITPAETLSYFRMEKY